MKSFGVPVPDTYVKEGGYLDFRKAAQLTQELLDLPDPPTCIIYPNDFSALGGIGVIHERKLMIPDDISIAGYDGIPLAKAMSPEKERIKRIMITGKVSCGDSVKNMNRG